MLITLGGAMLVPLVVWSLRRRRAGIVTTAMEDGARIHMVAKTTVRPTHVRVPHG